MLRSMLNISLFKGIAEEKVREISAFSEFVTYRAGEHAILEGGEGHHPDLLFLISGEVNVGTKYSPLPTAMEYPLHAIKNEMFGEVAWILESKRTAGVHCKEHCNFIRINGEKLFEYCRNNPAIGVELISRIAAVLAQRVVWLTEMSRNKDLFSR